MKNPLVLFTGAALATLAALIGLNMTDWPGDLSDTQKPAEAASQATDMAATPKAEQPAAEQTAKTPEKSTEVAAIPAPEPPQAETQDKKPELDTVRVESDGQAIVAGTAKPGSEIALKLGDQVIGKGVVSPDGSWVVVPDQPLPKGPNEITIEQKTGDAAPVLAEQSIAVAIPDKPGQQAMVALTQPGTATKVLQAGGNQEQAALTETPAQPETQQAETPKPARAAQPTAPETTVAKVEVPDAVSPPAETTPSAASAPAKAGDNVALGLAAVDYDDTGDIIFSGRAKPGTAVRLYVDNRAVGDASVDAGGNWTFAGKNLIAPGTHNLRVDQIDKTGKVMARVELPFVRENAEAVAALNAPPAPPKTEAPAETSTDETSPEAPAQKSAELPAPKAPEQPAQPATEQPAQNAPQQPAQQTAEQPQTTPAPAAPEPAKTAEAEPPKTVAVPKTEPAAPPSNQPTGADKKPEAGTTTAAVEPAKVVGADKPRTGKVVIQPGNNLWKLSRVIYGRGKHYTVIYQANKDQLRSPSRIYPGQILATPGALPPERIDPKRKEPLTSAEGGAIIQ